jgi:hypothetical protein
MNENDRIAQLERQINDLDEQIADLRTQLMRAELDQWQGRIDDLEVQIHLGSMAASDRLAPFVEELRNRWLDAQRQLDGASSTASDVAGTLLRGLEQAMKDIRAAVLDARSVATT